jgi:hypothetical protein
MAHNLNPFEDAVLGLFEDTGITKKKDKSTSEDLRAALKSRKGTIDNVAATLIELMDGAENENVRLSAAKMIASAHGALNEISEVQPTNITFNIVPLADNSQTMINILMPQGVQSNVETGS